MIVPEETKERVADLFATYLPELRRFEPLWPRYWARRPAVDLIDRGEYLLLTAEMPGITKDQLEVTILDNKVTIKGSVHKPDPDKEGRVLTRERLYGEFARTVELPVAVDAASSGAHVENGILVVKLPKGAGARPRRIEIYAQETKS
jgi:HSP20 family protein